MTVVHNSVVPQGIAHHVDSYAAVALAQVGKGTSIGYVTGTMLVTPITPVVVLIFLCLVLHLQLLRTRIQSPQHQLDVANCVSFE